MATIYGMTVDQNGKRIATIYPAKLNDGTVCLYDETRGLILRANGTGKLTAVGQKGIDMSFEPMTTVRLLKSVPLDNSYSDTLTFDTAADQTSYFLSKTKFTANELTYQRENYM